VSLRCTATGHPAKTAIQYLGGNFVKDLRIFLLASSAAVVLCGGAQAADLPAYTKAPVAVASPVPPSCTGVSEFFVTNCLLSWYGITVYGTVDTGGNYQTHGAPFNRYFPQGTSYSIGNGKYNRQSQFSLAPGGLSQSAIGIKGAEPIGQGWNFVFQLEAGFDPYSLQLANGAHSLFQNSGLPVVVQSTNSDSSRSGQFYNSVGFVGVSSPTYGTLTVFRQNSLTLDAIATYDPMAASYAFSQIGYSSITSGAGISETARATTSVKYRVNYGDLRGGVLYQFGGYQLDNSATSAIQAQFGGDIKNLGKGVLSIDGIFSYEKNAATIALSGGTTNFITGLPSVTPQFAAATLSDNTAYMALAKYVVGPLKLYAGYEYIHFAPPSDVVASLQAPDGTLVGFGGFPGSTINSTAYSGLPNNGSDKHLQSMWAGARYTVIENLEVAAAYYHYIQNNYYVATTAANQNCSSAAAHSQCAGTLDAVSFVVDWKFAPKWDTYIGVMYSALNGGLSNGYLARNNIDPTAGVRFRF
jgi:predicted porin